MDPNAPEAPEPSPDSLTLCCGGRKCPKITQIPGEPGYFLLSDDDEGATPLRISAAQLGMASEWAAARESG